MATELFLIRIKPEGVLDVKPHFILPGELTTLVLNDPFLFETDQAFNFQVILK